MLCITKESTHQAAYIFSRAVVVSNSHATCGNCDHYITLQAAFKSCSSCKIEFQYWVSDPERDPDLQQAEADKTAIADNLEFGGIGFVCRDNEGDIFYYVERLLTVAV